MAKQKKVAAKKEAVKKTENLETNKVAKVSTTAPEIKPVKNYDKQTRIALIVMGIIIGAILVVSLYPRFTSSFDYVGLKFLKTKFGEIPIYHAQVPLSSVTGDVVAQYPLNLRNDPRKLENIPIVGQIKLMPKVIITADKNIMCPEEVIAGAELSGFITMGGMNQINVSIGTTNKSEAGKDLVYADCNSQKYSVISFELSNKTQIIQEKTNCYKIQVNNCEIVKVAERFIIGTIAHAQEHYDSDKF